jgi:hypothetical protein
VRNLLVILLLFPVLAFSQSIPGGAVVQGQTLTPQLWNTSMAAKMDYGVVPLSLGGNGTATPSLTAGSNITLTGTWPNYTISGNNPSTLGGVFYVQTPITNATIAAAATAAYSAGGGTVQFPAGTFTLTAPVCGPVSTGAGSVCYPNVIYNGSGYAIAANGVLTGTVLQGDGTFDGFDYNNVDCNGTNCPAPAVSPTLFVAGYIKGFGVTNLSLTNFAYGMKIGALYNPGMSGGIIENVSAVNNTQWGFWIENMWLSTFRNLDGSFNTAGNMWFGVSGAIAQNGGNSLWEFLTVQMNTSLIQRSIVFAARGPLDGTTFNQFTVNNVTVSAQTRTPSTQAATMDGSTANITVTDSTKFAVDAPVTFSATVNGFTVNTVYFVTSIVGNVIQVSSSEGGTAINTTGTTAVNITAAGFEPLELVAYGTCTFQPVVLSAIDLVNNPTAHTPEFVFQNTREAAIHLTYVTAGAPATGVLRGAYGTYVYGTDNSAAPSGLQLDIGNDSSSTTIAEGAMYSAGVTAGLTPSMGIGFNYLSLFSTTDARCQNGAGMISITSRYRRDVCANKNNKFWDFQEYPFGARSQQFTTGSTVSPGSQTSATSNIACAATGSANTLTLPLLATGGDGIYFHISNPSTGTCTVSSQSSQPILSAGASVTSVVLAPQSNADFWSISSAGTLEWSVSSSALITGTTGTISGSVANGACDTGTATLTGVASSMALVASAVSASGPGAGWSVSAYMSASNTATVQVCNATGATGSPTSTAYNVRAIP